MSRGLGRVQFAILRYLSQHEGRRSSLEIGESVLGGPPSRSRVVSLRRAIHALDQRGYVRTGYMTVIGASGSSTGIAMRVWLRHKQREFAGSAAPPKRWAGKDELALKILRRVSQADVERWLTRSRTARGYGPRSSRSWMAPPADPPWIPYQLAARQVARGLLAVSRNGPLTSNTSRSVRRLIERLRRAGQVELLPDLTQSTRLFLAVRCTAMGDMTNQYVDDDIKSSPPCDVLNAHGA